MYTYMNIYIPIYKRIYIFRCNADHNIIVYKLEVGADI